MSFLKVIFTVRLETLMYNDRAIFPDLPRMDVPDSVGEATPGLKYNPGLNHGNLR